MRSAENPCRAGDPVITSTLAAEIRNSTPASEAQVYNPRPDLGCETSHYLLFTSESGFPFLPDLLAKLLPGPELMALPRTR